MNDVWGFLAGKKTYVIGWATLAYIVIQYFINKQPVDQEILLGALAAMGITLRSGVANGGTKPKAIL